jgi:hypothetical protein
VDEVLARALEKTAAARFPSARDFGNALGDALDAPPRSQLPTIPDEVHREASVSARIRRVAAGSAAVGALAGVALLELTSRVRSLEAEPAAAASVAPAPSVIVGWLAPSARPRPKPRPAASSKERARARGAASVPEPAPPAPSGAPGSAGAGAR